MCEGVFTGERDNSPEIALGCENGYIYILRNFAIHKHVQVGHPITHLQSLNSSGSLASTNGISHNSNSNGFYDAMALDGITNSQQLSQKLSTLVCVGHFNALRLYSKAVVCFFLFFIPNSLSFQLIKEIPTQDWVHTFAVEGDTEQATLVAGLANNSIQVFKLYHNTWFLTYSPFSFPPVQIR